jgi:riboflavin kinase/FMN adenylyltransferase
LSGHIYSLSDIHLTTPSIVTIGVFDGVHLGHQRLVQRLVQEARASGRTSVVITFFPHPDVVLKGVTGRYYLTTPDERARLLLDLGVDLVVTHPFDDEVRHMRAADFVDRLRAHLNLSALWVGRDFALGYKREGDVDFLRAQGQIKGFEVEVVDLESGDQGMVISSTRVREALVTGDVAQMAVLLGRYYSVSGEVVHGDHRGRLLGFPTANLHVWEYQLLPSNGIYACWAYVEGRRLMAMTNIGIQPTFVGQDLKVEAYLLDFEGDLYGQTVRLDFVEWLRPEERFDSIDALIAQIQRDVDRGRELLAAVVESESS